MLSIPSASSAQRCCPSSTSQKRSRRSPHDVINVWPSLENAVARTHKA